MATRYVSEDDDWFYMDMCPMTGPCSCPQPEDTHFRRTYPKARSEEKRSRRKNPTRPGVSIEAAVREFDLLYAEETKPAPPAPQPISDFSGVQV